MRLLVADDDLVSRLAMEDVVRPCGTPEIVLAEDGSSAWRAMNGPACFDLLCLDVRMPPPDGLELAARLRAAPALRRVPAMLITATATATATAAADRDTVLGATRSDLQGFVVKPVGAETVTRVLRVLAQLDASILEPADSAVARLRIDVQRHARYVAAFGQQVRALAVHADELETASGHTPARTAFVHKADACRMAALMLAAPRIEQLISDALALLAEGKLGASRAMAQAAYWLARVSAQVVPAA